jgi:hypothetical protein
MFFRQVKNQNNLLTIDLVCKFGELYYEFTVVDSSDGNTVFTNNGYFEEEYTDITYSKTTPKMKNLFIYCFEQYLGHLTGFIDVDQDNMFEVSSQSRYMSIDLATCIYKTLLKQSHKKNYTLTKPQQKPRFTRTGTEIYIPLSGPVLIRTNAISEYDKYYDYPKYNKREESVLRSICNYMKY